MLARLLLRLLLRLLRLLLRLLRQLLLRLLPLRLLRPLLRIQHLTCYGDTLSLDAREHADERPMEPQPRPGDHSTTAG